MPTSPGTRNSSSLLGSTPDGEETIRSALDDKLLSVHAICAQPDERWALASSRRRVRPRTQKAPEASVGLGGFRMCAAFGGKWRALWPAGWLSSLRGVLRSARACPARPCGDCRGPAPLPCHG